ncbi:hypothetical protein LPC10_06380 [Methylorubrum sp. B1-46]|uniref:hypothetical protein n=1 Tax=Methylorubrum sp. B1-46 TaxID=2897334 RepID=UPI001E2D7D45|nr:hypothetical protein [Methylorubrum sp. B1-46]UGB27203.1 hypothetical protein LPC10_06380 [Methylorubrum sp. B1-46]
MTICYNRGHQTKHNWQLYIIRSIVCRYLEVMMPRDPYVAMPIEDQELFYTLNVLGEVIHNSNDIVDMWNLMSPSDIRKMLTIVGERLITTTIDQKYVALLVRESDDIYDTLDEQTEEEIAEYYGAKIVFN